MPSSSRGSGWALAVLCGLALLWPARAWADLVRLSTGQVMSVEACRFEGDTVTLTLREGGEVRMARSLVAEVAADEVVHVKPVPLALVPMPQPSAAAVSADGLRALVERLATQFGVDTRLAHAVVQVESNYQPRAVSAKGAKGLMQLMPDVVREFAVDDPFDPEKNLGAGLQHLRDLIAHYANLPKALAAYNAGEGAVSKYNGIPPFPETQQYVRQVLALVSHP